MTPTTKGEKASGPTREGDSESQARKNRWGLVGPQMLGKGRKKQAWGVKAKGERRWVLWKKRCKGDVPGVEKLDRTQTQIVCCTGDRSSGNTLGERGPRVGKKKRVSQPKQKSMETHKRGVTARWGPGQREREKTLWDGEDREDRQRSVWGVEKAFWACWRNSKTGKKAGVENRGLNLDWAAKNWTGGGKVRNSIKRGEGKKIQRGTYSPTVRPIIPHARESHIVTKEKASGGNRNQLATEKDTPCVK